MVRKILRIKPKTGNITKLAKIQIRRMICQLSNKPKSLQISSAYPILTPVDPPVSNPNRRGPAALSWGYRPSTPRFKKSDMVAVAVTPADRNQFLLDISPRRNLSRLLPAKIISTLFWNTLCLRLPDEHRQNFKNCSEIRFIAVYVTDNQFLLEIQVQTTVPESVTTGKAGGLGM
jgi:hypothetical protein